ncbi:MAG: hypothetical protein HRU15_11680, partial [Planctomycetes bacterium]|nr:hypothetical protein [Planctomycetota bacterium]
GQATLAFDRAAAIDALATIEGYVYDKDFLTDLQDEDEYVRQCALELFIKKTPVKECRCKLEALFVRESSSRVRLCMASVLSKGEK